MFFFFSFAAAVLLIATAEVPNHIVRPEAVV